MLVVPDATKDPRFAANDLVIGEPGIRFYPGAPLVMEVGSRSVRLASSITARGNSPRSNWRRWQRWPGRSSRASSFAAKISRSSRQREIYMP